MYQTLREFLLTLVNYSILLFEYTGVIIMILACLRGIYEYVTRKPAIRLNLAKGMAMGLEFKLGSEILRTVAVHEITEIFIIAGIVILRAMLTFLIRWEIKDEESTAPDETSNSQ